MTQRASVGQGDIERALKACKRAGYERARVHINLREQTIDILLGEDSATHWETDDGGDDDYG